MNTAGLIVWSCYRFRECKIRYLNRVSTVRAET